MLKGERNTCVSSIVLERQMRYTILYCIGCVRPLITCIPSGFKTRITSTIYKFVNPDKSVTIVISSNPQINKFSAFVGTHYGSWFQISCRSAGIFLLCNFSTKNILQFSFEILFSKNHLPKLSWVNVWVYKNTAVVQFVLISLLSVMI